MIQPFLQNKRILFFSPSFFNYEVKIKDKMEQLGAKVYMYDERSVTRPILRAFLGYIPSIFDKYSSRYFNNIISKVSNIDFDYIFVIKGEMIPKNTLATLKTKFPNAKLCLYLYDSIKHIPGIKEKLVYYDSVSTFDRIDCQHDASLKFRPLFFTDDYRRDCSKPVEYLYDWAFCGTIHSDRFKILRYMQEQSKRINLKYYTFLYLQAKFVYYLFKLTKNEFRGVELSTFDFDMKTGKELADAQEKAKAIVDIQTPNQYGLTMRTIEMIGLRKKLITTNDDIVNYDFYNTDNICVISRCNPEIPKKFFDGEYRDLPNEIYEKYYIESWIKDILN